MENLKEGRDADKVSVLGRVRRDVIIGRQVDIVSTKKNQLRKLASKNQDHTDQKGEEGESLSCVKVRRKLREKKNSTYS